MRKWRSTFLFLLVGILWLNPILVGKSNRQGTLCGAFKGRVELELAVHRMFEERLARRGLLLRSQPQATAMGNIAVMEADAALVAEANPFDLRGVSIAFVPGGGQAYRVERQARGIDPSLGHPVEIGDDDSLRVDLDFTFPFFGVARSRVFLNSDGNLTFVSGDSASTSRSVSRFLTGPPRIALFFDDLDPSASGEVRVASLPDKLVVTWDSVPEWDEKPDENQNTFQVVLQAGGRISMRFGERVDAGGAVVGLSVGSQTAEVNILDLSAGGGEATHALYERFLRGRLVDNVAAVRRFYQAFPDAYEHLILWTNFASDLEGAFAFETTIKNQIRGIGEVLFDRSSSWGSGGTLESFVFMGNIDRYPATPRETVTGAASRPTTLGLLGHEVGHRWLAKVRFRDGDSESDALLGRQSAHWSFFFDSDASFVEGNEFREESAGRFRSMETVIRYCRLDLYLMGLARAAEVPPFFYIADANGADARGEALTNESTPERGALVRGQRRNVLIDDVIRAQGPREPDFENAPKRFRQAWLLLYLPGRPPTAEQVAKIDAARVAWEGFFGDQTMGRGLVSTFLER